MRRIGLLPVLTCLLWGQTPAWKEFWLGPAARQVEAVPSNVRQGVFHSTSISLKSLIGVATGVAAVRIEGPAWLDSDHYAISATISDETRMRLRTREPDDPRVVDEFRTLLTGELVQRFHLEFHKETRETLEYTLQPAEGSAVSLRASAARERGRLNITNAAISHDSTLDAHGITFRTVANWLQGHVSAPVTASTTLPDGGYDFQLKWKSKDNESLMAALKSQLGVELVKDTQRQEYLVVDRADPSKPAAAAPTAVVTAKPDSSIRYAPAELRKDLRVMRDALEEGHPGIYRYTPKAELDRAFERAATQLNRPMTALEAYRVLAPAVARLECGHTALRPSRAIELRLADEPLLPVEVAILGGKVYVARDFSEGGGLPGAEILSINDAAIGGVLKSMLAVVHGDGESATAGPYQLSHGRGFARNLYLIAGLQSPFRLQYATGGRTAEATINGLPLKAMRDTPSAGNATWRLLDGGSIGMLKIKAFDGMADGVPMGTFFERVFAEIHEKGISRLILDVRDNGGGEDELGRKLFAYFADQPFRYYRDLIVNKLSFRFFQYAPNREPLPDNVKEMVKPGADGKYHVVGHPNWGMQQPAAPHFAGKVVVLMNGGSFSTTCEFLATLHHHGGATFVGAETAGGYYGNTSGAEVTVVLPNSKLMLPVQLVGYYMAIEGGAQGAHGIRPDHPVEYSIDDVVAGRDREMEVAMRVVRQ